MSLLTLSAARRARVLARPRTFFFSASCLAVALALPASVPAQPAITLATVTGSLLDPAGAPLAGATVVARSRERDLQYTATTDARGRYRFLYLPVDTYEIRVDHPPYRPLRRRVALSLGQSLDLPLALQVEAPAEEVEVQGEVPLLETVRSQVAETVLPFEVEALPLNGRNYLDLAALTPAVSRQNPVGNQRFPETSAVPGTGISVTGQRFINNTFVVDGLSANDDAADLPGTFFSQEVIREFQVVTSGGIAEFGRASAGTVNVLTRSGTNDWRGSAYGFFRDDALDAKNPLAPTKDDLRQWQYGASAGFPLVRGRTFAFASLEQTRNDYSSVITIAEASVAAVNQRLDATSYPGPRIATGLFGTGYDSTNLFARLDHRPSDRGLLTARYSFYDISSPNARNVGGLNAESRGTSLVDTDHTLALSYLATLNERTVNETRAQITRSRLEAPPNDLVGPAVNVSGVASFGTATSSPTARAIDLYELVNTTTSQRGGHGLKAGIDLIWNRVDIGFPGAVQGVYSFSSLANFLVGRYINFQQAFGAESQFQSNFNLGLFLQDEWRLRRDLTLNLGLRYDLQFLPDPIGTDTDNWSPRIGLAWSPGGGRTVIRASAGLFYDRIPLRATSNALQRDGTKYQVAVLSFGQAGAPVFPGVLGAKPSGFVPSITTIDPALENGRTRQASLQVERQIARDTTVSLAYLHVRGEGIIMSRNINVPTLSAAEAAAQGVPNLGRPDSSYGNVSQYQALGHSWYDGLTFSVRRRFAGWTSARVSYTFSKALDDAGNAFFFTPQDNAHPEDEKGRGDNDQRHRLTLSGTLEVPAAGAGASAFRRFAAGFGLGGVYTYGSPLPFNIVTGADRNNDTTVNDRPVDVARNTGVGFDFSSLDLRLSKRVPVTDRVRLNVLVEAFNVLNRPNYQLPNNTFGTGAEPRPGFGRPTAAADPRQIQFGLRLDF